MKRSCSECWLRWARRRAKGITQRLGAARYVGEGLDKRVIHAVLSPPEGEIQYLSDVSAGFRDAYRLAEEKGIRGGVVIFHGYRVLDEWKGEWGRETNGGEDGPKLWKWVREHERDWRDLTYWSPHYHILGLCRDFEADDPEEQGGWVARRIRSLDRFEHRDIEGYDDMVGVSIYLLSHASFESDSSKDCVRWFGELSTAKFSPEGALSDGIWQLIQRKADEAAQSGREDSEEGGGAFECGNCGASSSSPIWDAGGALSDRGWCERIGREQQRRLQVAFEWVIGERKPPPGLKHPSSEEEVREAFEEMVEHRDKLFV